MLDEICPVQFVEGVNEGEEQLDETTIEITHHLGTGLQYIPKTSYSLTRLQVILILGETILGETRKDTQIRVDLCSDYKGKPSDIVLGSGSFVPKRGYGEWQEVAFKPVSLIKNWNYWITIHPSGCQVALLQAQKGQSLVLSVKSLNKWGIPPAEPKEGKVMLRFYGRILPISG